MSCQEPFRVSSGPLLRLQGRFKKKIKLGRDSGVWTELKKKSNSDETRESGPSLEKKKIKLGRDSGVWTELGKKSNSDGTRESDLSH